MSEEIKREDLTTRDIVEAMTEPAQQPALDTSDIEMLKKAGLRDISELNNTDTMAEIAKSVQITQVLEDSIHQKKTVNIKTFLEQHLKFLVSVSSGKSIGDLVETMTLEHAKAVLKTSLKLEVDDNVVKKHLKTLRGKYRK